MIERKERQRERESQREKESDRNKKKRDDGTRKEGMCETERKRDWMVA